MSGASTAEPARRAAAGGPVLVIGLGNPILGDDGVGWAVAEGVAARLAGAGRTDGPTVEVDCLAVGGLALMERLVGAGHAIVVDAAATGGDPPGTIRVAPLDDVPSRAPGHLDSPHDVTLRTALDIGRALGAALPAEVTVVTVEVAPGQAFGDALSPAVAAAVPPAAEHVVGLLERR